MTTGLVAGITDELVAELEALAKASDSAGEDWVSYADLASTLANQCDIDYIVESSPATILALLSERAELKRDADKYRKLRDGADWPAVFASSDAPEPLRDDDLDAAMELQL